LIVRDLSAGPKRFVELQRVLPGISTEQLRSRLNRMVADGMLTRKRYREVPPRVDYELTERARELMPILGELARWGYDWAWGSPRSAERIDVGAIFRLAPGLVHLGPRTTGSVELTVTDGKDGNAVSYVITAAGGRASIEERNGPEADARVEGSHSVWVAAFSPNGERGGLKISGDRALANELLAALGSAGQERAGQSAAA